MEVVKNIQRAVLGLIIIVSGFACTHNPVIPMQPAVSFSKQVQPVIIANCTMSGCHNDSSRNNGGEGTFSLVTYIDIVRKNMVTPGKAKTSRLYTVLTGTGENPMPPKGSLANDDILTIYLWIEQGAKNN